MALIFYDYHVFPYVDDKKLIPLYVPIISIRLGTKSKIFPKDIECIPDSGSDFNLFPAEIGETLGIKVAKGKKREHTGIGNAHILAYEHSVKIFLQGHSFKTDIHFSYNHKIPLLGRYGFFKYFKKVIFNEKALRLELEY